MSRDPGFRERGTGTCVLESSECGDKKFGYKNWKS